LPNSMHTEFIIKAAEAGKHILIEKPICIEPSDFNRIKDAVNNNNVHILEALMMQHHPWQDRLKEIITSGKYGKIISTETTFCLELTEKNKNSYRYFPDLGGGVFFDCSPYWVQFMQLCLGLNFSSITSFSKFDGPNKVDLEFEAVLKFGPDVESKFFTSYIKPYTANHSIQLEHANIIIRTFTRPSFGKYAFNIKIKKTDGNIESINFEPQDYYVNQLNFFIDVINNKRTNIQLDESFERISVIDKIYSNAKN